MADFLVSDRPNGYRLDGLRDWPANDPFRGLRPCGEALRRPLRNSRRRSDGFVRREQEDHCRPPPAGKSAVPDCFEQPGFASVPHRAGRRRMASLPPLFPEFARPEETSHG